MIDPSDSEAVLGLFGAICDRTTAVLAGTDDWSASGERDGQYAVDVAIDVMCLELLHGAGFSVLSEESGVSGPSGRDDSGHVVVVDLDESYIIIGTLESADANHLSLANVDLHDHSEANCTKEVYLLETKQIWEDVSPDTRDRLADPTMLFFLS